MAYEFKVGDTGLTTTGFHYEVWRYLRKHPNGARFAVYLRHEDKEWIAEFQTDGAPVWSNTTCHLLPPAPATRTIKRWLVALADSGGNPHVFSHRETERTAAEREALQNNSLMPDGRPQEVTMEILEKPRQA